MTFCVKYSNATKAAVPAGLLTMTILQLSLKPVVFLHVSHPTTKTITEEERGAL